MARARGTLWVAGACAAAAIPAVAQPSGLDDNFDCYTPGDAISAQPGWELWPNGEEAYISNARAFSRPNSLHLDRPNADVVHRFSDLEDVRLTFSVMTYVPGAATGMEGYISALNSYGRNLSPSWSILVKFDTAAGLLEAQPGVTTPLIVDRWVEWRAEVDIPANTIDLYYDSALWADDLPWTGGVWGSGGFPWLDAINFFIGRLDSGPGMYIDDVLVTEAGAAPAPVCPRCEADCDGSGGLDFFDFLCFQVQFATGDPQADCDDDGELTFFDFLCFQSAFATGCA